MKNPMAKANTKISEAPKTTAQQLSTLIKSARDIMRKDKGLNGDLDRLPLLTWIMFLKFLDDREKLDETRADVANKKYKSAVEAPYRWRDWAADSVCSLNRIGGKSVTPRWGGSLMSRSI